MDRRKERNLSAEERREQAERLHELAVLSLFLHSAGTLEEMLSLFLESRLASPAQSSHIPCYWTDAANPLSPSTSRRSTTPASTRRHLPQRRTWPTWSSRCPYAAGAAQSWKAAKSLSLTT